MLYSNRKENCYVHNGGMFTWECDLVVEVEEVKKLENSKEM